MLLEDIQFLQSYILGELNVWNLNVSQDRAKFNIKVRPVIDGKLAGARLKVILLRFSVHLTNSFYFQGDLKTVTKLAAELTQEQLTTFEANGEHKFDLGDGRTATLTSAEMKLLFEADNTGASSYSAQADGNVLVLLDSTYVNLFSRL